MRKLKSEEFTARMYCSTPQALGKNVAIIGMVISNCFASAKKKLKIELCSFLICPECEKKRKP